MSENVRDCLACTDCGKVVPAVAMCPQSIDLGETVTFVPACEFHQKYWWDGADWDGRHLERPVTMADDPDTNPEDIKDPRQRAYALLKHWHTDEVTSFDEAAEYADRLLKLLGDNGLEIAPAGFSAPDPYHIYLMCDQPTTCPKCGSRTNFDEFENHEGRYQEIHYCLNLECRFSFYVEEDEDDDDYE